MSIVQPIAPPKIFQARAIISNAQILTLPTTPVEIVPSAGSDKFIFPLYSLVRSYMINGDQYGNLGDNDSYITIAYEGDAEVGSYILNQLSASSTALTRLLVNGSALGANCFIIQGNLYPITGYGMVPANASLSSDPVAGIIGSPLYLQCVNSEGNFDGGNPRNYIVVNSLYLILESTAGVFLSE